ncbi:MAG: RNA polymerase factor sigma-32 [Oligoflexia bacterium]|nr:RNA polymerase factor sigma-32 [Oligoflexia bacterium]
MVVKKKKSKPLLKSPKRKSKGKIKTKLVSKELDDTTSEVEVAEVENHGHGLVIADPLQKYLADIRKYPLLTPEEERRLAIRVKEKGDKSAAEKLVTSNLRFVVKIAAEYSKFGARMIDLIQEGNIGLMHAVKEFNPYKGVKLITYAVWWIRGYIQEYLMKNYSQVKIGTTQAQKKLFYQLNKEKARLDALGQRPDVKLLSSRLGVTEGEVLEMESRLKGPDLSLDAPMKASGESTRSFIENQADVDHLNPDELLASEEEKLIFKKEIKKVMKDLNEKEIYLLQNRILGDPPLTLQEVGDKFKITRERARQLEERVLLKLRTHFKEVFPDYKINVPEE